MQHRLLTFMCTSQSRNKIGGNNGDGHEACFLQISCTVFLFHVTQQDHVSVSILTEYVFRLNWNILNIQHINKKQNFMYTSSLLAQTKLLSLTKLFASMLTKYTYSTLNQTTLSKTLFIFSSNKILKTYMLNRKKHHVFFQQVQNVVNKFLDDYC